MREAEQARHNGARATVAFAALDVKVLAWREGWKGKSITSAAQTSQQRLARTRAHKSNEIKQQRL